MTTTEPSEDYWNALLAMYRHTLIAARLMREGAEEEEASGADLEAADSRRIERQLRRSLGSTVVLIQDEGKRRGMSFDELDALLDAIEVTVEALSDEELED